MHATEEANNARRTRSFFSSSSESRLLRGMPEIRQCPLQLCVVHTASSRAKYASAGVVVWFFAMTQRSRLTNTPGAAALTELLKADREETSSGAKQG